MTSPGNKRREFGECEGSEYPAARRFAREQHCEKLKLKSVDWCRRRAVEPSESAQSLRTGLSGREERTAQNSGVVQAADRTYKRGNRRIPR